MKFKKRFRNLNNLITAEVDKIELKSWIEKEITNLNLIIDSNEDEWTKEYCKIEKSVFQKVLNHIGI